MLDKIRELAMEKFASTEEVDAFMEAFEKQALFHGNFGNMMIRGMSSPNVMKPLAALGVGLMGAAIVKGISSGSDAMATRNLRGRFDMALAQVISSNKIVRGAKPERTNDYAETIFCFDIRSTSNVCISPAGDVNISFLKISFEISFFCTLEIDVTGTSTEGINPEEFDEDPPPAKIGPTCCCTCIVAGVVVVAVVVAGDSSVGESLLYTQLPSFVLADAL